MTQYEENHSFDCPYCIESNTIVVDFTAGNSQKFVVDCEICCHPILIKLRVGEEGIEEFTAEQE